MTSEEEVEPGSKRMVPCILDGKQPTARIEKSGGYPPKCEHCYEDVEIDASTVTDHPSLRWANQAVSEPHLQEVTDVTFNCFGQCSCGGWYGTPVSVEAALDGSELPLLDVQARIDDLDAKVEHLINLVERLVEVVGTRGGRMSDTDDIGRLLKHFTKSPEGEGPPFTHTFTAEVEGIKADPIYVVQIYFGKWEATDYLLGWRPSLEAALELARTDLGKDTEAMIHRLMPWGDIEDVGKLDSAGTFTPCHERNEETK